MLQRKKCVYFFERTIFVTSLGKAAAGTLAPFEGEFGGKVESILKDPWSSRVQRKPQPGGDLRAGVSSQVRGQSQFSEIQTI